MAVPAVEAVARPQLEAEGRAPRTRMQQLVGTKLRVTDRVCVYVRVCVLVRVCERFNEITNYSKTHTHSEHE